MKFAQFTSILEFGITDYLAVCLLCQTNWICVLLANYLMIILELFSTLYSTRRASAAAECIPVRIFWRLSVRLAQLDVYFFGCLLRRFLCRQTLNVRLAQLVALSLL